MNKQGRSEIFLVKIGIYIDIESYFKFNKIYSIIWASTKVSSAVLQARRAIFMVKINNLFPIF